MVLEAEERGVDGHLCGACEGSSALGGGASVMKTTRIEGKHSGGTHRRRDDDFLSLYIFPLGLRLLQTIKKVRKKGGGSMHCALRNAHGSAHWQAFHHPHTFPHVLRPLGGILVAGFRLPGAAPSLVVFVTVRCHFFACVHSSITCKPIRCLIIKAHHRIGGGRHARA